MGAELTEDTIPAEAGQWVVDASVSFTKGCFTGQELVARIDSRGGNVPRHLRILDVDGARAGAGHRAASSTARSSAASTSSAGSVALAYVKRSVTPPAAVTAGRRRPGRAPCAQPDRGSRTDRRVPPVAVDRRLGPHLTAHRRHQLAHDGEPEPRARLPPRRLVPGDVEPLEDVGQVVRRRCRRPSSSTATTIAPASAAIVTRTRPAACRHPLSSRFATTCAEAIGVDDRARARRRRPRARARARSARPAGRKPSTARGHDPADVGRAQVEPEPAGVEAGQVEEVGHQPLEPLRLRQDDPGRRDAARRGRRRWPRRTHGSR